VKIIHIINGPNLNILGIREPDIYGSRRFEDFFEELKGRYPNIRFLYFQSNHEGAIIDRLQQVGFHAEGIILNAAGYTHTSIAIGDTVAAITSPVVEVHISDIYNREPFRRFSYIEPHAAHFVCGHGLEGYAEAVDWLLQHAKKRK
jgi:3-dehydroquinate dehydratase II